MSSGQDAKFFTRGKIQEFRKELQDAEHKDRKFAKRKTILKKIVANITMGNDMSPLFSDVVHFLSIPNLEIKKMVYLFIVSYGRYHPEQIQFAIPNFQEDCNDRDPLVRALAIRTMSYLALPIVVQALKEPLRQCLRDQDPYVRKTAALCVAKLYVHEPHIVIKEKLYESLRDLLADNNATVVANAVAALMEINERSEEATFSLNLHIATKLASAMGDCSEWAQIYILDSLLLYVPQTPEDAEALGERVAVRLSAANSAVVLSTIKVLLYFMNYMEDRQVVEGMCKKMGPPLITLLSSGPEVQYVALRNILLIIQRRPSVLKNDVKVFFCKYNEPIYVKLAKLEIMYRLARDDNSQAVLAELTEYATEVDVDFVKKAVRSIGRLAIKVESIADSCIDALVELIDLKINYVIQEAVIVIKDIFRRYPGKYERVIPKLCEDLDVLTEPEAKSSIIWIIGQYANLIENAAELFEDLSYMFLEEPPEVQLSLLTGSVKLFLHKSNSEAAKDLVHKVLKWATEEVDNPDLRDRGFMYWRLLAHSTKAASSVVLNDQLIISTDTDRMERGALDQLLLHTGTLSSIYHKNPDTFIRGAKGRALQDSPALNETSRKYLIQLPPPRVHQQPPKPPMRSKTTPIPPHTSASPSSQTAQRTNTLPIGSSERVTELPMTVEQSSDPYANLDNAFGNYLADEPKPFGRQGLDGGDDDLLF